MMRVPVDLFLAVKGLFVLEFTLDLVLHVVKFRPGGNEEHISVN